MGESTETNEPTPGGGEAADRPGSSRSRWIIALIILLPVLGAIFYTAVQAWHVRGRESEEAILSRDRDRLRELTGTLRTFVKGFENLPLAVDGRIDVYFPIREKEPGELARLLDMLRSERYDTHPTIEQIKNGDYHRFAYLRHRGKVPADKVVPLLWDPGPDRKAERLVAYSDGSVRTVEEIYFIEELTRTGQM